jgi:ABC-type Fe3+-hydroxamate transport system substrate-binding protein
MDKVFVINFDEAIIFKTNRDAQFYDEQYETFEEAKEQLINYWDNVLADAKNKLSEVKKIKLSNVQGLP